MLLQELGLVRLLEKEEIQAGVAAANERGDQEQASKSSPGGGYRVCWLLQMCLGPLLAYVLDNTNLPSSSKPNQNFTLYALCPLHPLEGGHFEGKIMTSGCRLGLGSGLLLGTSPLILFMSVYISLVSKM